MPRHAIDPRHGNHTENHATWHAVAHLHIAHEARAPRGALLSIFVSDRAIPSLLPRNGFTPISPSPLALGQSIGSSPDWQLLIGGWELVARGYRGTPCIHTCSCHGNREFRPSACRWQRCTPSQEGGVRLGYEGGMANRRLSLKERAWVRFCGLHSSPRLHLRTPPGAAFNYTHIRWRICTFTLFLDIGENVCCQSSIFSPLLYIIWSFFIAQHCNCCKSIKNKPSIKNRKKPILSCFSAVRPHETGCFSLLLSDTGHVNLWTEPYLEGVCARSSNHFHLQWLHIWFPPQHAHFSHPDEQSQADSYSYVDADTRTQFQLLFQIQFLWLCLCGQESSTAWRVSSSLSFCHTHTPVMGRRGEGKQASWVETHHCSHVVTLCCCCWGQFAVFPTWVTNTAKCYWFCEAQKKQSPSACLTSPVPYCIVTGCLHASSCNKREPLEA